VTARAKTALIGALMGGLVGPALGALLYASALLISETLFWPHHWSQWRRFGDVAALAVYAIVLFGVSGMCAGSVAGIWLARQCATAKRHIALRATLAGLVLGYVAAVLPMLLVHAGPWGLFFYGPLAAVVGAITANLFVWTVRRYRLAQ
jgi:hypothetical protein